MKKENKAKTTLNALIKTSERMKKYGSNTKNKMKNLNYEHPSILTKLNLNPRPVGRLRLESTQEGLLETIINIASNGGAAQERKQTNLIRTCRTLKDLNESLKTKCNNDRLQNIYL